MNPTSQTTTTKPTPATQGDGILILMVMLCLPLLPLLFILCAIEGATRGAFSRSLKRGL